MALVSDGTVFSHGMLPVVELHTYSSTGTLIADESPFDAPVEIISGGGSGCVATPSLKVQTTYLDLADFIGGTPQADCRETGYGISAVATSPLSATARGPLFVGPVNPLSGVSILFVGLGRLAGSHRPMSFSFEPPASNMSAIESTNCPAGTLRLTSDGQGNNQLIVSPPPATFNCTAVFPNDFSLTNSRTLSLSSS